MKDYTKSEKSLKRGVDFVVGNDALLVQFYMYLGDIYHNLNDDMESDKYYEKVYVPNRNKSVIIQGLDSLLWALSEAEMETINEQNQRYFIEMRFAVSKILRTLIDHLPDPEVDN